MDQTTCPHYTIIIHFVHAAVVGCHDHKPTVVRLNQKRHQVQAEASTAVPPCSAHIHLLERAKDLAELVLGDAHACVRHGQVDVPPVLAHAAVHSDCPHTCEFCWDMLHRIESENSENET